MCDAVRQIKESSKEEGIELGKAVGMTEGRAVGITEGKIAAYHEMGLSVPEISQKVGLSEAEVIKYLSRNNLQYI